MAAKTLGNIGYDAYCKDTDNKSLVTGATLPTFEHLPARIQEAWEKSGQAVASSVGRGGAITGVTGGRRENRFLGVKTEIRSEAMILRQNSKGDSPCSFF